RRPAFSVRVQRRPRSAPRQMIRCRKREEPQEKPQGERRRFDARILTTSFFLAFVGNPSAAVNQCRRNRSVLRHLVGRSAETFAPILRICPASPVQLLKTWPWQAKAPAISRNGHWIDAISERLMRWGISFFALSAAVIAA